tara:strand:- start:14193 stop:14579 length:387 start_codon:yes stop_codon:yes gene_type:complete
MPTRTIKGTLNNLQLSAGTTEITYLGPTLAGNVGDLTRGFRINPGGTGDITVTINKSTALLDIEIFQEDAYNTGNAPTGYQKIFNIDKAGKGKGAVGVTVTNAAKDYVVLLTFDSYADAEYVGTVIVP